MALTAASGDYSGKLLLLSNLVTISLAWLLDWGVMTVLWGYWLQSVIIGFFTVVRMLQKVPQFPLWSNAVGKVLSLLGIFLFAGFFALHYGGFHLGYAFFLWDFSINRSVDWVGIAAMGAIFFANHAFSFLVHLREPVSDSFNELFSKPYERILPMHLTIMLGGLLLSLTSLDKIVLTVFMVLKTAADWHSHWKKHGEPGLQRLVLIR